MEIAVIVKSLAPYLPFLLTMGTKAAEGASQKFGEDVWNKAKTIWTKLQPKVEANNDAKKAADEAAKNLEDEDFQGAFRAELKKILTADTALAEEIAKILQAGIDKPSDNIQISANAYDNSTVKQVGKIEAKEVTF